MTIEVLIQHAGQDEEIDMSFSKRQAEAVNQIIQDEVQNALKGRSMVAEYQRRAKLFEEAAGRQVEEATMLLSEARELLEGDPKLHKIAEDVFETAYSFMGQLDDVMTTGDESPDTQRGGGYPGGGGEDVDLPPMHPRGR